MASNMDNNTAAASIPGLTGVENFFKWRQAMEPILDGFRALLIVQGYDCCPTMPVNPSSTDLKLIEAWKDRDARARSLIQRTISGPMVAMTRALKTSSEMWLLLHDLNDLNTSDHRATINRRLANLFLEESGDMTEHLNTYIEMVAEAEAAGLPWGKQGEDKALCFLDTLDHAFRPIKSEWRGLPKEERTFFALIKIYKEEDVARKRSSDRQTEAAAMAAVHKPKQSVKIKGVSGNKSKKAGHRSNHLKAAKTSGSGNGPLCLGCGSRDGHIRADCPVAKHLGPGGIICWNCHKKGHSQTECPNNHAKAVYTKDEDILGALVEEHAMLVGESGPATVAFMVDSGASQHIVEHEWMLSNSRNIPEIAFKTVGSKLKANKAGDIMGSLPDGRGITFKDAVHVPGGGVNLLSEELLMERGWRKIICDNGDAILQHSTKSDWRLPLHKHGRARYLVVKLKSSPPTKSEASKNILAAAQPIKPNSAMDWHVRLGHINLAVIKKLAKAGMIDLLDVEANYKIWCETCQAAKATRDPFNDIPYRATKPVELVFSDLSGPFKFCFGGFKYFGTFIDDYSDLTTVVLIKTKDEIFGKFQAWVKATEKAFGHEVQVLRTDGGGEYMSKAMSEWLEKKGILHHVTPPHTPQLNGKAERKNRTLKEMTAAMLIGSNMSTQWWGHAIMFACGLLMRITKTVDGRTVWEIIHKRKPSLTKAHAFGAECWVHIPAADRLKSDLASPKAWKGKLVSWPTERSGWGIYNPKTDKIVFSRDISFSPRGQEDTSSPQEAEIDPHEVIRVEDFLEPDDDEEEQEAPNDDEPRRRLPAVAEQREQPREAVRMGDRPVRELPRRVNRGQHSDWYRQNFVMFIQELEGHLFPISPTDKDPLTYEEALARPDPERQEWIDAIDREFNSLIKNGTLEEVIVPEGANVVSTKHVFKTKYDANGNFIKRKDRCVARGFTQEYGVDYNETYAPVARMTSLRIFLVMVIVHSFVVWQTDVETAFLNPDMDRPLYIEFPKGWKKNSSKSTGLLVKKGLYGFKQSARLWWLHLMETLEKPGFSHSETDWGIFLRNESDGSITVVFVYVDDILIAAKTKDIIDSVCDGLKQAYTMTDIGEVSSVLGISVRRTKDAYYLNQSVYIQTVLERFGLEEARSEPTPVATGTKLVKEGTPLEGGKDGISKYQACIGCLLWVYLCTRGDIGYIVSALARFSANPTKEHWRIAMRVLRYLKGTQDFCLELKPVKTPNQPAIVGYSDADWAGEVGGRQSQSGYLFKLYGCAVSWASLRQDCVSLSSVESEYVALTEAGKEAVWLVRAVSDYGKPNEHPVLIRGDNQGALALAENPGFHRRTKHIELRYHYIRKLKSQGTVNLEYVDTHNQTADILTKPVSGPTLFKHRDSMGLQPPPGSTSR